MSNFLKMYSSKEKSLTLDAYFQGKRNSLNLARAFLASLVCVSHVGWFFGQDNYQVRSLGVYAVAIFFGLSGFLIYQSAITSLNYYQFLLKRIRRIFPAFLLVLISTSLIYYPLHQYISSGSLKTVSLSEQINYLVQNLTLHIFKPEIVNSLSSSTTQDWNPSLWTLEFEFALYLICFMFSRFLIKISRVCIPLLVLTFAIMGKVLPHEVPIYDFIYLAQFYFFGMTLWQFRKRVIIGKKMLPTLTIATTFAYLIIEDFFLTSGLSIILVLSICLKFIPHDQSSIDYSYGIYLHAGPITHLVVSGVQASQHSLWIAYLISLITTIFVGALSWHLVESRFSNRGRKMHPRKSRS